MPASADSSERYVCNTEREWGLRWSKRWIRVGVAVVATARRLLHLPIPDPDTGQRRMPKRGRNGQKNGFSATPRA